jgi:hypothetical protein
MTPCMHVDVSSLRVAVGDRARLESLTFDFADDRARVRVIVGVAQDVAKGFDEPHHFRQFYIPETMEPQKISPRVTSFNVTSY